MEILDRQILFENESYKRVREYVRGWYPDKGILHVGWQGRETIIERDVITPIHTFEMTDEQCILDIMDELRLIKTPLREIGDRGNEGSY